MTDPGPSHQTPTPVVPLRPNRAVPPFRLIATLGMAGAMAGFLIVFVYRGTLPAIETHKAEVLQQAIEEVLRAPQRFDTLYLREGTLSATVPSGVDARRLERVYVGYAQGGERVGFAVVAGEPGFQDMVRLIFGYDPATGQLLGMKVLESKETPGLGDKIEKDTSFVSQFAGLEPPLVGVKAGPGTSVDPHQVDMITGATISSRTVIKIINQALTRLGPLMDAYPRGDR